MKNKVVISIIIIILLVVVSGLVSFNWYQTGLKPVDKNNNQEIVFEVKQGSLGNDILNQLVEQNLIRNKDITKIYMRLNNVSGFKAGVYNVSSSMSVKDIINVLTSNNYVYQVKITIPEGLTLKQIAELYASNTNHSAEAFLNKWSDETYLRELQNEYWFIGEEVFDKRLLFPLEGYLAPNTYQYLNSDLSIEDYTYLMLKQTENILNKYQNEINNSKYTIHEILTFASVIQQESGSDSDKKAIAGVFQNRLDGKNEGTYRLESDPTVIYAMQQHKVILSWADTEFDSPFNTYRNAGLPIGPIGSASNASIEAAINPTKHDYIFFFAKQTGEIVFTKTYTEHLEVAKQFKWE